MRDVLGVRLSASSGLVMAEKIQLKIAPKNDVADDDLVAELREARARDETDPPRAEDAHLAHDRGTLLDAC